MSDTMMEKLDYAIKELEAIKAEITALKGVALVAVTPTVTSGLYRFVKPSVRNISQWPADRDMTSADAEEAFKNYRNQNPKKTIGNSKIYNITTRFWHRILWISKVNLEKNVSNLTAREIQNIIQNLCENEMSVSGKSTYKDEFVTAGGVELKEVDFKNMSSKILSNFYLAGEVLNIDAVTGGFNFQACWSEAWLMAQDLNSKE